MLDRLEVIGGGGLVSADEAAVTGSIEDSGSVGSVLGGLVRLAVTGLVDASAVQTEGVGLHSIATAAGLAQIHYLHNESGPGLLRPTQGDPARHRAVGG